MGEIGIKGLMVEIPGNKKQDLIQACLLNVLNSQSFSASERLSRFLRYVVVEAIEGRADRLKGYAIAISVFDCGDDFDPQTNSVVRVEAVRLRKRLAEYYAGPGKDDPLEIRINRGTYVPVFVERTPAQPEATIENVAPSTSNGDSGSELGGAEIARASFRSGSTRRLAMLAIAGVGLAGLTLAYLPGQRIRSPTTPATAAPSALPAAWLHAVPSLTVTRFENSSESSTRDTSVLAAEVASALGRFEDVRVFDRSGPEGKQDTSEYRLVGMAEKREGKFTILFRLLRAPDDRLIWSHTYETAQGDLEAAARRSIIAHVVSSIARTGGVLMSDRYKRMAPISDETLGYECVVHAAKYYNEPSPELHRAAGECLERSIKADPKFARASSALAMLILNGYVRNFAHQDSSSALARASDAANDAVALSPQSAQSHLAMFLARFYDKRFEDARGSAGSALSYNPYSIEIRARIGSAYILRGEYDEGMKLLKEAGRGVDHVPAWLEFYYFLHAYMREDFGNARRHAARSSSARTPLGVLAKILMASKDGDAAALAKWIGALHEAFPRFARDIPGAFERMSMAAPLKSRLLDNLAAAGLVAK